MSEIDGKQFKAKDAIVAIALHTDCKSRYAIAKALTYDDISVSTTQISNYLKGKRMSRKVADRVLEVFGIIITDVYEPSDLVTFYGTSIE